MTEAEKIADKIIQSYVTDSGTVIGIPVYLQETLRVLLIKAAEIGRDRELQSIEDEKD